MRHRPRRRLSRAAVAFSTLLGLLAFGPAAASTERVGASAANPYESATAVFGKTLDVQGVTVDASPGGDEASANARTYGDRDCWEIGPGRPSQYLYVTVDARLKHEGVNHAAVDIDYFDAPGTKFALVHDGVANPWRTSRIVRTTGTNTWKTAHFYIPDGAFAGGQYGRDMRIATWAQDMGTSEKPVCFARYTFAPSPVDTDDVRIDVTTPGNLFDPGARATFGVLAARDRTVPWSVRDYRGRNVRSGTAAIDPATREGAVDAGELPLGYYTLTLRGTAGDGAPVARTAGFAVQRPGPDPKRTTDSFFGINHHYRSAPGDAWDDSTKLAARAGADALRVDSAYWASIEHPKGEYQWPEASERVTADFGARGQNGLMLLGFGNSDYGNIPSTDEAYQAFGKYAGQVAEKAGGRIESLEVWNEYYGGFSNGVCSQSAKCYAKMLDAAYSGIKAADPNVTVVGASSFKVPLDWFEELFELGALRHMDAISIHPYRAPGDPEGVELDIAGLKRLMRQYNHGRELPIWITEHGWTSADRDGIGVSEQTQAQATARALLEAKAAGIARYYWYDLINDGNGPSNGEHNFGLLRRTGPEADGLNPKPAYLAYSTVARELTGAQFTGRLRTGDRDLHAYSFRSASGSPGGGAVTTALWSGDRSGKPVRVRTGKPVTVVDMLGAERVLEPVDGWVYLTATGAPVFLRTAVDTVEESPLLSLSAPKGIAAGTDVPVTATLDNRATGHGGGMPTRRRTAVFETEGERVTVSAAPGRRASAVLKIPAGDMPGSRGLTAAVTLDGKRAGAVTAGTQVTAEPVSVDVSPEMSVKGATRTDRLAVTVTNHSPDASVDVTGIDWSFGDRTGTIAGSGSGDTVPPLATRTFRADVDGASAYAVQPVEVTARLTDGRTAHDSDSFGFSPIARATPHLVDGRLTGLENVPKMDLSEVGSYNGIEPSAADGDMWATWDDKNLYVSAVVREKDHRTARKIAWLPAGDSIGIGVQPGKPGEGLGSWGADWYMLYAGDTVTEGPGVFVESLPKDYPVGSVEGADVRVARDEGAGTTTYLVAVPWKRIAPLSPGDPSFSLTLTVDKNDGVQRENNYRSLGLDGWQTWGDGLNNWKLVRYQQVQLTR
ncbi:glycosyl hydrolase [Streptomyces sp. JV185]|uniref:glycosyl hydrolase n=1 Tax=Streptomyces sp. JV185 TaxID=858638 RepID=UPI002E778C35|nr:glycosyl hydrolase [Streptomyces sp. JV185]MEE1770054.1 glycosyl hydrolase [Streptomyces sp. JV185]